MPPRGLGHALTTQHPRDFFHTAAGVQRRHRRPRGGLGHALLHEQVVLGVGGDRGEVGHAQHLAPRGGLSKLLSHRVGDAPAYAGVHLVEDHVGTSSAAADGLDRQHGPRQLAAETPSPAAQLLAGFADRRNSTVSAPRTRGPATGPLERSPSPPPRAARSTETRVLHAEGAQLTLDQPLEPLSRLRPRLRQDRRRLRRARGSLRYLPLSLLDDRVVTLDPVERPAYLLPVGGDGSRSLAVLPLHVDYGVEALVDLPQPVRIHDRPIAEPARPRDGVFDIGLRALERLDWRGSVGVEAREIPEERSGAADRRAGRLLILVQESHDFLKAGEDPLGVLEPPALRAQLVLLAFPELDRVDLGDLPAVELLFAGPLAGLVADADEVAPRRLPSAPERVEFTRASPRTGEAIDHIQLAQGSHEPMVSVL